MFYFYYYYYPNTKLAYVRIFPKYIYSTQASLCCEEKGSKKTLCTNI